MNFPLFFSIFAVVMSTFVGGLLVWLHIRIGQLKASANQMPMLEEKFTKTLMGARTEMQALEKFASEKLPGLDTKLTAARQAIDEIDYMLSKTEKSMNAAEEVVAQLKSAAPTAATVHTTTAAPAPQPTAAAAAMMAPKPTPLQQQAYTTSAQLGSVESSSSPTAPQPKTSSPIQHRAEDPMPDNNFRSAQPKLAIEKDGTPSFVSESISRAEMASRNQKSRAEQSLRDSLAEILK